jgi:lipopolysaccharide transport system ATP-binding protein
MHETSIELSRVSKYYKLYAAHKDRLKEALHPRGKKYHTEFYALRDVSLKVGKGEILGVVGKNGSGKSTLLKLICRVLTPSSGRVECVGKISALLELGSGFNPDFTGLQNIYFYATIVGLSKKEIDERLEQIIAFADIGEFIHQPLRTYSSGMRARLGFAVAVHIEPEVLILDEVLAVGDELFRRKCHAKMEEFFKGGKTIIYVSHDANSINQLCTRAVFLHGGKIVLDGPPAMVTKYYQKLLYSVRSRRAAVLDEIRRKNGSHDGLQLSGHEDGATGAEIQDSNQDEQLQPYFLDNLVPINVLVYGGRYRYTVTYKSAASREINDVAFGCDIKNSKGVIMMSVGSVPSYENGLLLQALTAGEDVTVTFDFTCRFVPGLYFVDSGLSAFESGQQEVLNRKVDIACFKVIGSASRIYRGMFNTFEKVDIYKPEGLYERYTFQ